MTNSRTMLRSDIIMEDELVQAYPPTTHAPQVTAICRDGSIQVDAIVFSRNEKLANIMAGKLWNVRKLAAPKSINFYDKSSRAVSGFMDYLQHDRLPAADMPIADKLELYCLANEFETGLLEYYIELEIRDLIESGDVFRAIDIYDACIKLCNNPQGVIYNRSRSELHDRSRITMHSDPHVISHARDVVPGNICSSIIKSIASNNIVDTESNFSNRHITDCWTASGITYDAEDNTACGIIAPQDLTPGCILSKFIIPSYDKIMDRNHILEFIQPKIMCIRCGASNYLHRLCVDCGYAVLVGGPDADGCPKHGTNVINSLEWKCYVKRGRERRTCCGAMRYTEALYIPQGVPSGAIDRIHRKIVGNRPHKLVKRQRI